MTSVLTETVDVCRARASSRRALTSAHAESLNVVLPPIDVSMASWKTVALKSSHVIPARVTDVSTIGVRVGAGVGIGVGVGVGFRVGT